MSNSSHSDYDSEASYNDKQIDSGESLESSIDDSDSDFQQESISQTPISEILPISSFVFQDSERIKTVDLDRKLPAKYKKHEHEPNDNSLLLNISNPITTTNFIGDSSASKRNWPEIMEHDDTHDDNINMLNIQLRLIPLISDWFSLNSIHEIEIREFPLFCGSESSPTNKRVYKIIRNSMVQAYVSEPMLYLSITECYQNLRYDTQDIISIHSFLERYHIINYHVILSYIFTFKALSELYPKTLFSNNFSEFRTKQLKIENWVYQELDSLSFHESSSNPHVCFSCTNSISLKLFYSCRKFAEFKICESCFVDGVFPADVSSKDFVKVSGLKPNNDNDNINSNTWTEKETQKLLAAIEIHDESWNEISKLVGTKTPQECLSHFLCLPIEEEMIYNSEIKDDYDMTFLKTLPGKSSNPLMALITVFANICPEIASAAAKAALRHITESKKFQNLSKEGVNEDITKLTLEAASIAFTAAIEHAKSIEESETHLTREMVTIATELKNKVVELKLIVLDEFL